MTTTPDPRAAAHASTVVAAKRRLLDSPYGRELHDLAEVEILACELRELVALAERARPDEQPAAEQDGDGSAAAACCSAAEMFEHDADCETRDADGSAS